MNAKESPAEEPTENPSPDQQTPSFRSRAVGDLAMVVFLLVILLGVWVYYWDTPVQAKIPAWVILAVALIVAVDVAVRSDKSDKR